VRCRYAWGRVRVPLHLAPIRAKEVPAGEGWLHEVKFDGYRVQVHKVGSRVIIFRRNRRKAAVLDGARLWLAMPMDARICQAARAPDPTGHNSARGVRLARSQWPGLVPAASNEPPGSPAGSAGASEDGLALLRVTEECASRDW
jgi:hypothetical protein